MYFERFGNRRVLPSNTAFRPGTAIEFPCDGDDVHFDLVVKEYFYNIKGEKDSEEIAQIPLVNLCVEKGPIYFISDIIERAEEISDKKVAKPVYVDKAIVNYYYKTKKLLKTM